ncbi:hypothetical protein NMG60_11012472 [Bertholletia excelsa]
MESAKRTLTFKVPSVCEGYQNRINKIRKKIPGIDTISYDLDEFTVTFIGTADRHAIEKKLAEITKNYKLLEEKALPVNDKMAKAIATAQEPVHEMEAPPQDKSIIKIDQPPKHEHRLKLIKDYKRFACNGCKMDGFDARFRCEDCTYELHKACYEPKISIFPKFFPDFTFHFCNKAPTNSHSCVACGNTIQGHFYFCGEKAGLYLHPSCSELPVGKLVGDTVFDLVKEPSSRCMSCKKNKGVRGWFYKSKCKKYRLHVHCITQLAHEAWKKVETEKTYGDASTESNEELIDAKLRDMLKRKGRSGLFEHWKPLCSFLTAIIRVLLGDVSGIVPTAVAIIQLLSN